jgi:hypothetical protein
MNRFEKYSFHIFFLCVVAIVFTFLITHPFTRTNHDHSRGAHGDR